MTPAERQRRCRRKIRKTQREAEMMARRDAGNARRNDPAHLQKLADKTAREHEAWEIARAEWQAAYGRPALPDANEADELARQIDEWLAEHEGLLTVADVRAALDRRFGKA